MAQPGPLTQKQEQFCLKFIECGNASEAYRHAYDTSNSQDKTVWEKASKLLSQAKVKARVEALREKQAEKAVWSAEKKLELLQQIMLSNIGEDDKTVISALNEHNKMRGDLAAIKTDNKHSHENLSEEDLINAANAIASSLGITQAIH